MVCFPSTMIAFWVGFFIFVAILLALDLGVLHRKAETPTLRSAAKWTAFWMALGFAFTAFVYYMFDAGHAEHWQSIGEKVVVSPPDEAGKNAAIDYVSGYLLEYALSVDNIFVIALLFRQFRVPTQFQHRVLFWGIMGAIVFRLGMLAGGAKLAETFDWIFYVFGLYLAWQGFKLLRHDEEEEEDHSKSVLRNTIRRFVKIVEDDTGKFMVRVDGRRALTTLALCLISIELTDIVFALDSIPAILGVVDARNVFIMVTSNIFAIMGLRSLYFVLAGAMAEFKYLKIALAILLIIIGAKLFAHNHVHVPNAISLIVIASIIGAGVIASIVSSKRAAKPPSPPTE
jgi:tellurite resistance protein TerC